MSKGKRKKRRHGHGQPPAAADPQAIMAELESTAAGIAGAEPAQAGPMWGAVHKLLLKVHADPGDAGRVVATRDLAELERLLAVLRGDEEAAASAPEPAPDEAALAASAVPPELQKKAMRAFRKRLKLIRLDHESKLGVGPMTGGKKADFDAIMPPQEFETAVWEALVATGRLRRAGPGFYMLAESETDTS
ncbi:MAG: hypothetical protein ACYTGG_05000 [Planctomycetota bacterium]|jgi:hypothetical protein